MTGPESLTLDSLISGYWLSQAIYVAAKLGIADLVQDAPQTAEQLAAATDAQPEPLYRFLRTLASIGIFREDEQGRFTLTPKAEPLCSHSDKSMRAMAIMMGEQQFAAWSEALYAVRTGKNAFEKVHGEPIFDWMARHPDEAAIFDRAMVNVHGRETAAMADAYDFSDINVLADVGGGNGSVLRGVLARHPKMRGMLCDLPGVIERARPALQESEVADRLETRLTDFFAEVPSGADAYLMRHIIHDWDDEKSLRILNNVRAAIPDDGRLLVVESVVPPGNDPSHAKLLDLHMMIVPGGKERTEEEYRALYQAAGFWLASITPTATAVSVIEGRPV